jgi:hypothetical protein
MNLVKNQEINWCVHLVQNNDNLWGSQGLGVQVDAPSYPSLPPLSLPHPPAVLGGGPEKPGLSGWIGGAGSANKCLPLIGGWLPWRPIDCPSCRLKGNEQWAFLPSWAAQALARRPLQQQHEGTVGNMGHLSPSQEPLLGTCYVHI